MFSMGYHSRVLLELSDLNQTSRSFRLGLILNIFQYKTLWKMSNFALVLQKLEDPGTVVRAVGRVMIVVWSFISGRGCMANHSSVRSNLTFLTECSTLYEDDVHNRGGWTKLSKLERQEYGWQRRFCL